ncbi:MAG TPA: glycine zipper 2TM domain-containing protein [Gemmatimonadales bacterium]|nr:glycine zipper 2TM domain-containing protein [Gemmatimonadales bacterium]
MTMRQTIALLLSLGLLGACAKGENASNASADSTARNLTLAPADSSAAMRDAPATPPAAATQTTTAPPSRPAVERPRPPAAPATLSLAAGSHFDMAATDTITSRTAKAGDAFTARVVEDVRNAAGKVVIPAGSSVSGTITEVKPAPNPNTPGTLTLAVSSVTIRGTNYPLDATIDSLETVHKGRGITTGDAAKVGAGAVAGAVLGRVIGGNKRGTIIGGIVGGAVGAGVAQTSKDSDIVLPAGAHIVVTVNKPLTVKAS